MTSSVSYEKELTRQLAALRRYLMNERKMSVSDWKEIRRAYKFAKEAHAGVTRKSGEPYIMHPMAVARIVAEEMGLFRDSIIAAFLHDVVEDTDYTLEDISREFNVRVSEIVDGLTKMSKLSFEDKTISTQAENFRRILLTISEDIRVILVKIADRLHNMRTLEFQKDHKQLKIASETLFLYAPLAHRLGLYNIKSELEDLSLKYSQPAIYQEISSRLDKTKEEANDYIEMVKRTVSELVTTTALSFKIKSRFKSIYSIHKKISEKGVSFEEIFDLYAIRIILETRDGHEFEDCWKVYAAISAVYYPNPTRTRIWLSTPKESGYQALHMTVIGPEGKWVEIQIRTERMDDLAEKGPSAHWRYKKMIEESASSEGNDTIEHDYDVLLADWVDQIRTILENPELSALEAVQEVRRSIRPEDMQVFTPKGQIIRLPTDATVIDFAYYVHTKVGQHAIGAKVNGRVVSLDYILQTGDQCEVLTSTKQQPKEEWLKFVKTTRAKNMIKEVLRQQRREYIVKGKEIFIWYAKRHKVTENSEMVKEFIKYLSLDGLEDLYYNLGRRNLEISKIQEFNQLRSEGKLYPQEKTTPLDTELLVLGKNITIEKYESATCCNPVPGDDIIAFHKGTKAIIHRTSCEKAINMMATHGDQIVKVRFTDKDSLSYLTALKIEGLDRQGILIDILQIISRVMHINMRKVTIDTKDGLFQGLFLVYLKNKDELDRLTTRLKSLDNVTSVMRTDSKFQPFEEE